MKTVRPERTRESASRPCATQRAPARERDGRPRADQRRRDQHQAQQPDRRQAVPEQRLLAAGEQPDRGEHHGAEDHQREHVDQRLGDERAEHDRQSVARAAEPARDDQRARGLAEARGQRRRHQHADRRALHGVDDPRARVGQRRLQDRVPGDGAQQHRGAHQRQRRAAPTRAEERTSASPIRSSPMCWTAR